MMNITFGRQAHVVRVHQHGPLLELVAVLLQHHVGHGLHQRVRGVQQAGHGRAHAAGDRTYCFSKQTRS
jgi:hypothetical protein